MVIRGPSPVRLPGFMCLPPIRKVKQIYSIQIFTIFRPLIAVALWMPYQEYIGMEGSCGQRNNEANMDPTEPVDL